MGVLAWYAIVPQELGVAGGQGGRWGLLAQPGAGGEGHGICICRADTFSTCGQRAAGPEGSSSWGDPVSDPAPGAAADTKHQRTGNSKASLLALPVPRTAQGLAGIPCPGARQGWRAVGTCVGPSHTDPTLLGPCTAPGGWGSAGSGGWAVGKASAFHHGQNVGCSCRAGGPAAHDPGSMGLKLEGGRRAAHSTTPRSVTSTPQTAPPAPSESPRGLGVTLGDGSCPWPRATGVGQDGASKIASELPGIVPGVAGERTKPTSLSHRVLLPSRLAPCC